MPNEKLVNGKNPKEVLDNILKVIKAGPNVLTKEEINKIEEYNSDFSHFPIDLNYFYKLVNSVGYYFENASAEINDIIKKVLGPELTYEMFLSMKDDFTYLKENKNHPDVKEYADTIIGYFSERGFYFDIQDELFNAKTDEDVKKAYDRYHDLQIKRNKAEEKDKEIQAKMDEFLESFNSNNQNEANKVNLNDKEALDKFFVKNVYHATDIAFIPILEKFLSEEMDRQKIALSEPAINVIRKNYGAELTQAKLDALKNIVKYRNETKDNNTEENYGYAAANVERSLGHIDDALDALCNNYALYFGDIKAFTKNNVSLEDANKKIKFNKETTNILERSLHSMGIKKGILEGLPKDLDLCKVYTGNSKFNKGCDYLNNLADAYENIDAIVNNLNNKNVKKVFNKMIDNVSTFNNPDNLKYAIETIVKTDNLISDAIKNVYALVSEKDINELKEIKNSEINFLTSIGITEEVISSMVSDYSNNVDFTNKAKEVCNGIALKYKDYEKKYLLDDFKDIPAKEMQDAVLKKMADIIGIGKYNTQKDKAKIAEYNKKINSMQDNIDVDKYYNAFMLYVNDTDILFLENIYDEVDRFINMPLKAETAIKMVKLLKAFKEEYVKEGDAFKSYKRAFNDGKSILAQYGALPDDLDNLFNATTYEEMIESAKKIEESSKQYKKELNENHEIKKDIHPLSASILDNIGAKHQELTAKELELLASHNIEIRLDNMNELSKNIYYYNEKYGSAVGNIISKAIDAVIDQENLEDVIDNVNKLFHYEIKGGTEVSKMYYGASMDKITFSLYEKGLNDKDIKYMKKNNVTSDMITQKIAVNRTLAYHNKKHDDFLAINNPTNKDFLAEIKNLTNALIVFESINDNALGKMAKDSLVSLAKPFLAKVDNFIKMAKESPNMANNKEELDKLINKANKLDTKDYKNTLKSEDFLALVNTVKDLDVKINETNDANIKDLITKQKMTFINEIKNNIGDNATREIFNIDVEKDSLQKLREENRHRIAPIDLEADNDNINEIENDFVIVNKNDVVKEEQEEVIVNEDLNVIVK